MDGYPFFLFDSPWTVPVAGAVGFALVVVVGRLVLTGSGKPSPSKEVLTISPDLLKGVTQDRRAAPRRKGNVIEVQIIEGDGQPFFGAVLDRSQGGLKLSVSRPVAEGTILEVKPTNAGTSTPWIEVIVRSCARDGSAYTLGCQFRGMPDMGVLFQFG